MTTRDEDDEDVSNSTPRAMSDTLRHVWTRHDQYLLDQVDASQQIHSKVNKVPVDALFLVFFLFQHEHVMVEELL